MKGTIKILLLLCVFFSAEIALAAPIVADSFSTTWDTSDGDISINLGVCPDAVYWEEIGNAANNGTGSSCDGSFNQAITFPGPGQYRVDFSGAFTTIRLSLAFFDPNRAKFRSVEQWGTSAWVNLSQAFANVPNLSIPASDVPDLSQIVAMGGMFRSATNFNDPINSWDMSQATDLTSMFHDATSFNQPLNNWNVSQVTNMSNMFAGATSFNQDISSWDVSQVTTMGSSGEESCDGSGTGMFTGATSFNQDISAWNVSNVQYFCEMFSGATTFNQDISGWNVANATDMSEMFLDATAFDQDVSSWQIQDGDILLNMFRDSGLSSRNYSNILTDWAALSPAASGIDLGIVSTTYCDTAETARTTLIDTYGWSITDLGPTDCPEESVSESGGGAVGTKIGLRQKRLNDLQNAMSSSTASVSEKLTSFVSSLKKFLNYLTTHEEEVKNLSPEESKAVIIALRDAILELLKWLPGVSVNN